jgi:hypothetical protein
MKKIEVGTRYREEEKRGEGSLLYEEFVFRGAFALPVVE